LIISIARNKAIRASFVHAHARAVKPLPRAIPGNQRIGATSTNQNLVCSAATKHAVIAAATNKFLGIAAASTQRVITTLTMQPLIIAATRNKAICASLIYAQARAVKPLARAIPGNQRIGATVANQMLACTATAGQPVVSVPAVKAGAASAAKQAVIARTAIKFLGIAAAGTQRVGTITAMQPLIIAAAGNKAVRTSFIYAQARAVKPLPRAIPGNQRIGATFTHQILACTATAAQPVISTPAVKTGATSATKQTVIARTALHILNATEPIITRRT
jgi:hypothetical protein